MYEEIELCQIMSFISDITACGFIMLQLFHFTRNKMLSGSWLSLSENHSLHSTGVAWHAKLSHLSPSTQTAACPLSTAALGGSLTPLRIQICPQETSLTHLVLLTEDFPYWHTPSPKQPDNTPTAAQCTQTHFFIFNTSLQTAQKGGFITI